MGLLTYMARGTAMSVHKEIAIDNFTVEDGDIAFFSLIRATAMRQPISKILDYGAGRNYYAQDFDPARSSYFIRDLRDLRYNGANVTAADVSEAVLGHPTSDRQIRIQPDQPLPFEDGEFDMIVSDFVFEHVRDPALVAAELQRVLKPGGWLFVRTPNKWGYVAIVASMVPNRLHSAVLRIIQPTRKETDVFPTHYRLNTPSAVAKAFDQCEVSALSAHWEPQYFFGRKWLYHINRIFHALVPNRLGMTSIFMMRKRETR
jgi:SAM-dependent methyltransferase